MCGNDKNNKLQTSIRNGCLSQFEIGIQTPYKNLQVLVSSLFRYSVDGQMGDRPTFEIYHFCLKHTSWSSIYKKYAIINCLRVKPEHISFLIRHLTNSERFPDVCIYSE